MREPVIYLVRWDNDADRTYLYGTELTRMDDGTVVFTNEMMPSGMVIREWESLTNYQSRRIEPQLPLMEAGDTMTVRLRMRCVPENAVFLRINFYDYHKEQVDFTIIRGGTGTFTFPEGAYSYNLQLIEAGSHRMVFWRIELIPDGEDPFLETKDNNPFQVHNPSPESRTMNILLPVQNRRIIRRMDPDRMWNIDNLVFAPPELAAPEPFFSDAFLRRAEWQKEWKRFDSVNLIGFGREGIQAAYTLEYRMKNTRVIPVWSEPELMRLQL